MTFLPLKISPIARTLSAVSLSFACAMGYSGMATADDQQRNLTIGGYVENVQIAGTDLVFKARLDSGATISSLNALDLETFERDDAEWVRFDIIDPTDADEKIQLEYPVKRTIRIVQHSGNHQHRPVIELGFCIGEHYRVEEVSLVDRSHFTYQMLVGRNHMVDALLIDPAERFILEPHCPDPDDSADQSDSPAEDDDD